MANMASIFGGWRSKKEDLKPCPEAASCLETACPDNQEHVGSFHRPHKVVRINGAIPLDGPAAETRTDAIGEDATDVDTELLKGKAAEQIGAAYDELQSYDMGERASLLAKSAVIVAVAFAVVILMPIFFVLLGFCLAAALAIYIWSMLPRGKAVDTVMDIEETFGR